MDCKNEETEANREKAMLYYTQNGLPKLLEELLNEMFYDNPDDIFAYLTNYFQALAKPPVFSKIAARLILTAHNGRGLKVLVYYSINSKEKLITQVQFSFNAMAAFSEVQEQTIVNWINDSVNQAFQGSNFKELIDCDNAITKVVNNTLPLRFILRSASVETEAKKTENRKLKVESAMSELIEEQNKKMWQLLAKSIITWGLSSAMCSASAALYGRPLLLHLRRLYQRSYDKNSEFLVTVFHNTKATPSKLLFCSEVGVIVPTTQGFTAMVHLVQLLYETAEKILRVKTGMPSFLMSEKGAILLNNYEKLDVVMELIQEFIASSEVLSKGNLRFFVCGEANEIYDEKGRYEILKNVYKSGDEMVDLYSDLMKKFPLLSILIDPFHPEDDNSWSRLPSKQEESACCVVSSLNIPNIVEFMEGQFLGVPGIVVQPQIVGSISDFIKFQNLLEKQKVIAILDVSTLDVVDVHLIDMVIGCSTSMIKIGGTVRGERAAILNRMLEVDLELESCDVDDYSDVTSNDGSLLAK